MILSMATMEMIHLTVEQALTPSVEAMVRIHMFSQRAMSRIL